METVKKIAVNGGHYPSKDCGAKGPNGLEEADVTKEVSEQVCAFLSEVGYETLFIQENELYEICEASDNFEADLLVSIHCNAADDSSAHGMEIFTTRGETDADALASFIMAELAISSPTSKLAVRADYTDGDVDKEENFYVLRNSNAAAVLVELAFISNPKEEAMLADKVAIYAISAAIARGITNYHASL